jgi:multidrug transporter EmrE-like cation transporter
MDLFTLSILKFISLGKLSKSYVALATVMYAIQPHVFLESLKYENMTTMNLMWDLLSDVLITGTGLFFFKETISQTKMLGIGFAIMAVILFCYPDAK